jgi:hypothetical protein
MFFRKKPTVSLDMGVVFDDYFVKMLDVIRPIASNYSNTYDFELLTFLYSLTLFYSGFLKKNKQEKVRAEVLEVLGEKFTWYWMALDGTVKSSFSKRMDFYTSVVNGLPLRCEWCAESNQPDIRLFIAFGDRIFNTNCCDDYENAPLVIRSIFEVQKFAEMMNEVKGLIQRYIGEFKKLT